MLGWIGCFLKLLFPPGPVCEIGVSCRPDRAGDVSVPQISENVFDVDGFAKMREWEARASLENQSAIYCQTSGGLGNKIISVIASGILAVYFNKPIICYNCPKNIFHFPPVHGNPKRGRKFPDIPDLYNHRWERNDPNSYSMWFFASDHLYLHDQIGRVLYENFGKYAIYYIGNYFFKIPDDIKAKVDAIINQVPKTVTLIGVHIRTHYNIPVFMRDVPGGTALVSRSIKEIWKNKPYQVALATENDNVERQMRKYFPDMLRSGVHGVPDGDAGGALVDFYFIQSCQELVLTYRSTFSIMLAALANKTGYFYCGEWDTIVKFSSSQIGLTSMLHQRDDAFNDKSNTKRHMLENNELVTRLYFKYHLV